MASWALAAKQIAFSWQTSHKQQAARNCLFYTQKFSCVSAILRPNLVLSPKPLSLQRKLPETLPGLGVDPQQRLQDHQNECPCVTVASRDNHSVLLVKISTRFLPLSPGTDFCLVRDIWLARSTQKHTAYPSGNFLKSITIK